MTISTESQPRASRSERQTGRKGEVISGCSRVLLPESEHPAQPPPRPQSHFRSPNWARSADFRNLPAAVLGISPTNSNASGTHHLGMLGARNALSSSAVAAVPVLSTTTATGLSPHLGWGDATTAASRTA